MSTFRDLLARTKTEIRELDTAASQAVIDAGGVVVLDVREPDEYDQGAIPGAVHIPRGHLEAQIEARVPDKTLPVVVYCAGGVRSAFAAKTLQELGYADVVSMAGGISPATCRAAAIFSGGAAAGTFGAGVARASITAPFGFHSRWKCHAASLIEKIGR